MLQIDQIGHGLFIQRFKVKIKKRNTEIQHLEMIRRFFNLHIILKMELNSRWVLSVETCINIWVLDFEEVNLCLVLISVFSHFETKGIELNINQFLILKERFVEFKIL